MTNVPAWLHLALLIGATARLTRVVTADYITRGPREWVIRRAGEESKLAYLITCDWCASIYVALVVAGLMQIDHPAVTVIAAALTASHVTGIATRLER